MKIIYLCGVLIFFTACSEDTGNKKTGEKKTGNNNYHEIDTSAGDQIILNSSETNSKRITIDTLAGSQENLNHNHKNNFCTELDTCVNSQVIFIDGESMRKSFDKLKSACIVNDRIYFMNKDSTKFISFGTNYGGREDEYQNAVVGYIKGSSQKFIPKEVKDFYEDPLNKKHYPDRSFFFSSSRFSDFETQSGIKLGLTEEHFNKITKNKKLSKKKKSSKTTYKYVNDFCMYEAEYIFEDGRLIGFSFGYVTP